MVNFTQSLRTSGWQLNFMSIQKEMFGSRKKRMGDFAFGVNA